MQKTILLSLGLLISITSFAQKDTDATQVRAAIWNYINGRNNGDVEQLKKAFHPDADLRHVRGDSLRIWPSAEYIAGVKPGKKQNCVARLVYLDIEGNAGQAKVEIEYPNWKFADYLNLLKIDGQWKVAVKSFAGYSIKKERVLFVITSHEKMGDTGRKTGLHLGEVSHVYQPIVEAGYEVDFVSPKGGQTYMYGDNMNDPISLRMIQNPSAYYKLTHAMTPDQVRVDNYAAIYFVGGHGTMWDLPEHSQLTDITKNIYEKDGIVAAVCHGPSGIVNVQLSNGKYLVEGKKVTAFTNQEEAAAGQTNNVPFLLESTLKERGALFQAAENWQNNVVVDGRLVTGQNPASAGDLAQEIIQLLAQRKEQ